MLYKLHQHIYFKDNNEQDALYFNWLFRAISLVDKKYLLYEIQNSSDIGARYHKERVFAYELYRQWANIIESECKEELVLNAELDKIITEEIQTEINKESHFEEMRKYPDLVLHHSQSNDENQGIICEIKRNTENQISGSSIFADLYKLASYLDKRKFTSLYNPFRYGVFILLNGDLELIKSIKKSKIIVSSTEYSFSNFKEEMEEHFDRIVCISYNGITLCYKTLKTLLSQ